MTDTEKKQAPEPDVLFEQKNHLGFITLNRPRALNALTLEMIEAIDAQLIVWAADENVRAVVIYGESERAFCAGGDVKAVALDVKAQKKGQSDGQLTRDLYRAEYTMNNRIFHYPKPYIALVDGIVMGGGVGISAYGSHRVITENTVFAMPETGIGFFPDVGGGYFLPRCPGETGLYLALTSRHIKAMDAMYIGFATEFVPAEKINDLIEALSTMTWKADDDPHQQVTDVIENFAAPPAGESELAPVRAQIDTCFGQDKVEDIFMRLQEDPSSWAVETLQALYAMSPISLKTALRQIRRGADMTFSDVMVMEYRLSQRLTQNHDFYEGIRAVLIDKDKSPKWQPKNVADVEDDVVESFFTPLGAEDLTL